MQRTRSISIKSVRLYKAVLVFFFLSYFFLYSGLYIVKYNWWGVFIIVLAVSTIIYYWNPHITRNFTRLKELSYDDENLYIVEKGVEEQIPFHEVKDVEIVSLDGVYQFNFFNKNLHEGAVRCKTSMWYPLNFKTIDKELNRVRALIQKAHREYRDQIGDGRGLASFNG